MKRWSMGAYIALFLLAGVIIYVSAVKLSLVEFGQPGSGLLPFLLAVALAILSLIQIFTGAAKAVKDQAFLPASSAKRLLIAIAILIASGLSFSFLGAPATAGLMVALWLVLLERKRLWIAVTTGGLTGLGIWLVFIVGFKAQLPMGFWVR